MLRNYFLISLRNMFKHRLFTCINIFGLALSMSVCMVIILLISYHYRFDDFHEKGDRTYRIITHKEGKSSIFNSGYATSPLPIGKWLKENYSGVEEVTNLNIGFNGELISDHRILNVRSVFADENFFKVFSFDLVEGDEETALKEPYSLILSEEKAALLFPDTSAMGQLVEFQNHGSYKVTGIIKKPESPTHVSIEAFGSMSTIPLLVEKNQITEDYDSWETIWMNYNYITVHEDTDVTELLASINALGREKIDIKDGDKPNVFELQKITEIVPGKLLGNEMAFALPKIGLLLFTALALIVIVTASINYTNLSIAKSVSRAKEIGIRKANGARKSQVILQFLIESIMTSSVALLVAIPIYKFLLVRFNEIWIFTIVGIKIEDTASVYFVFLLFTVFIGLITGLGPSIFLSKINILSSLKGIISQPRKSKSWFHFSSKKALLSIQFGLSIFLLVTIFLVKSQGDFLVSSQYGFDEEAIYYVELQGKEHDLIKKQFGEITGIGSVSMTSHHPATGRSHGSSYHLTVDQEPVSIYHFDVDNNYISLMGLELIAGNSFSANSSNQKEIIINEKAVEILGFENIHEAIGRFVYDDDKNTYTISGVLKDYHWEPIMKSIRPLALKVDPEEYEFAYFHIEAPNPQIVEEKIKAQWALLDEDREFRGGFLSEEMDMFYQFIFDLSGILTLIGLLAITITGLGFLGMLSFALKMRTKEIGIRKVLGANFRNLLWSVSKDFIIMLVTTSVIAYPIAIIANNLWISQMARHAPLSMGNIGPAVFIVLAIAMTTIVSEVWRNTRNNPVDALRSE